MISKAQFSTSILSTRSAKFNRAQDTYISNCRQKQKAREERTRIEKEQAYIGAVVLGMIGIKWKKKTKRNGSKNRLDCRPEKKARD
jgi:hypothetical protein